MHSVYQKLAQHNANQHQIQLHLQKIAGKIVSLRDAMGGVKPIGALGVSVKCKVGNGTVLT